MKRIWAAVRRVMFHKPVIDPNCEFQPLGNIPRHPPFTMSITTIDTQTLDSLRAEVADLKQKLAKAEKAINDIHEANHGQYGEVSDGTIDAIIHVYRTS